MKKDKSNISKQITYDPEDKALDNKINETFIQNGYHEIWSLYPFAEGSFKKFYAPGAGPQFGITCNPPTPQQIKMMQDIMQRPMTLPNLRAFLQQDCHITELSKLEWKDILAIFSRCQQDSIPNDLIITKVVLNEYDVTKNTLQKDIDNGRPKSYRKFGDKYHLLSREEVSRCYGKKPLE